MVEKGPTLGSIETSDYTKRQLSAQSLAFNLKDKVFCELFPDVVDEMKQKQKAQEELTARTQPLPLPDVVPDGDPQHAHYGLPVLNRGPIPLGGANPAPGLQQANRNHGLLGGALANLFVIVGFAAFAYTVKYVLRSIAQEWEELVLKGDVSLPPPTGEPASGLHILQTHYVEEGCSHQG